MHESESEVAQSCPTPSDPMDCSPPGSSVRGIFQARVLEWGALPSPRDNSTHGHYQMVNTEIRGIIFFAAEDGEALYSQQKQDWELTVAQIMNSLLQNSDLN